MLTTSTLSKEPAMQETGDDLNLPVDRQDYERIRREMENVVKQCEEGKQKLMMAGQLLSETVAENEKLEIAKNTAEEQLKQYLVSTASVADATAQFEAKILSCERVNRELEDKIKLLESANASLEEFKSLHSEREQELELQIELLVQQKAEHATLQHELESKLSEAETQISELENSKNYSQSEVVDMKNLAEIKDSQIEMLTRANSEQQALIESLTRQNNDYIHSTTELKAMQSEALSKERSEFEQKIAALELTITEMSATRVDGLQNDIDSLQAELNSLKPQLDQSLTESERLNSVIKELALAKELIERDYSIRIHELTAHAQQLQEAAETREMQLAAEKALSAQNELARVAEIEERAAKLQHELTERAEKAQDTLEKYSAELDLLRQQANDLLTENAALSFRVQELQLVNSSVNVPDASAQDMEKLSAQLAAATSELSNTAAELCRVKLEAERSVQAETDLGERLKDALAQLEKAATELQELKDSQTPIESEEASLSAQMDELRVSSERQRDHILQLQAEMGQVALDKTHAEAQVQALKALLVELESQNRELSQKHVAAMEKISSDEVLVSQLRSELADMGSKTLTMIQDEMPPSSSLFVSDSVQKLQHENAELRSQANEYCTVAADREKELDSLKGKLERLQQEASDLFAKAESRTAIMERFKRIKEHMGGFFADISVDEQVVLSSADLLEFVFGKLCFVLSLWQLTPPDSFASLDSSLTLLESKSAEIHGELQATKQLVHDRSAESDGLRKQLATCEALIERLEGERKLVPSSLKPGEDAASSCDVVPQVELPKRVAETGNPFVFSPGSDVADLSFKTPKASHSSETPRAFLKKSFEAVKLDSSAAAVYSVADVSHFKLKSEQLDFFLGQFEATQTVVEDQKEEIAMLKASLERLLELRPDIGGESSLVRVLKTQSDELRKVWAQGLSANQALRALLARVQQDVSRKFAQWREQCVNGEVALSRNAERLTKCEIELQSTVADYEERLNAQLSKAIATERQWMSELDGKQRELDELLDRASELERDKALEVTRHDAVLDDLHEKVLAYEEQCVLLQSKLDKEQTERLRVLADLRALQDSTQWQSRPQSKASTVVSDGSSLELYERKYHGYKAYCKRLLHECKMLQLSVVRLGQFRKDLSYQKQYLSRRLAELERNEMHYIKFLAGSVNLELDSERAPDMLSDTSFLSAAANSGLVLGDGGQQQLAAPSRLAKFKFRACVFGVIATLRLFKTQKIIKEFFA